MRRAAVQIEALARGSQNIASDIKGMARVVIEEIDDRLRNVPGAEAESQETGVD